MLIDIVLIYLAQIISTDRTRRTFIRLCQCDRVEQSCFVNIYPLSSEG